ncbi:MAG: addiction module antidote protein, partial [Thermodesulfobacteriota bacterium]|nr:addiction module antidote protein [Thermodesulfobacteriota bacterium]
KGMTKVAKEAGLNRESLYKALSQNGHPQFSTISKVTKALGCKLAVA